MVDDGSVISRILDGITFRRMNAYKKEWRTLAYPRTRTDDTAILTGYQIFHNYIRSHKGLEGKTPAEACGIKVEGKNKWITLIQNASKK